MDKKYIYCFINKINNKMYIGSTIQSPEVRYRQHLYNSKNEDSTKYNYPLYQAIRKYGIDNFKFEILYEKECSEIELRNIEKELIIRYNSLSPRGYNQTLDTEHPLKDEKTIKKMSETKRNKHNRVVELDKDGRIKQEWRSAKDCEEEIGINCSRITDCCRGLRLTTNNRTFRWLDQYGNIMIPKRLGYDTYKGETGTTQIQITSKKVAKLDKDTNKVLAIYPTIALASRENGCDASGISKVCKGKRKIAGGFIWKYWEE